MESPTTNVVPFLHRFHLLLKAHYFLFFAAFGAIIPILSITLRSRGLSDTELSLINIIIPFLIFLTNPLLGFIADRSRRYLLTFNGVMIICLVLYVMMFLLPIVKTNHIRGNVSQDSQYERVLNFCAQQQIEKCASRSACGCEYQASCTTINQEQISFPFIINSKNRNNDIQTPSTTCGIQYRVPINSSHPLSTCQITCSIPHICHGSRYNNQMRYIILYSLLFILGTNFLTNAIPLGASIGFAALSNPEIFGAQRVYGTVGFGLTAFLVSRLYKIYQTDLVYIIVFSIATISCMIVTSFIRIPSNNKTIDDDDEMIVSEKDLDEFTMEKKKMKKKKSHSQLSTLLPLFKRIDILVFLALTFVWGMSYAGLDPYIYLYLDEFAGCKSHDIIGWMSLTASIAEISGFFLAARLIKFLGTNLACVIILLAFTIRFSGYYLIREPYLLIAMETMHFFNFGILYVLIAQKADSIAPPGLSGTLQGVALGVSFGLARGVGLVIASFIYRLLGQRLLFLAIAIFNLSAAVLFSLYFLLTRTRSNDQVVIENDAKIKIEPLLKNQLET